MKRLTSLIGASVLCVAAVALAQEVIDRIAAVVNDEIILLSEVDEKLFLLQAQGQLQGVKPEDVDNIRRDILDRLVEERLVVQRARSQGITIDEIEITEAVDNAIQQVRGQFPSEEAFQNALDQEGITLTMLRERYENDVRQERLAQRIVGREIRSQITVTTDEVQKYFRDHQQELPPRPGEVHLAHLVVQPVSPERERAAQAVIEEADAGIRAGKSFEATVEALRGGPLGRFCRGDLDPAVEAVLDTLTVGAVSRPTRSLQGWHLFRILERDGECYEVEHVVEPVRIDERDVESALQKALAARARILAGEQFSDVVRETSDDEYTREEGGDLGWTQLETLLPNVREAVDTLGVGDMSEVVRTDRGFHVFRLLERREGGAYTFDEIRERLRGFLEQQKLEEAYDTWLTGVRDSAYVEIKAWAR